ncbi:MAG TPA: hypothetical protein IAB66_02335 [Candidatus Caccousia avistercoris]|nr:hypothetical protein [Candidatus Caccousia avistercoris]
MQHHLLSMERLPLLLRGRNTVQQFRMLQNQTPERIFILILRFPQFYSPCLPVQKKNVAAHCARLFSAAVSILIILCTNAFRNLPRAGSAKSAVLSKTRCQIKLFDFCSNFLLQKPNVCVMIET